MIAVVGFANLNVMQFLLKYTYILDELKESYDVIYWNRNGVDEPIDFKGNPIAFDYNLNSYQPFHKKVWGFVKYSLFIRKQIRSKKYDKVIVLTTQTAIPLFDILTRKFTGRFVYDYRDITKETRFRFYSKMVKNLIANSAYTMISSKGFLPEIGVEDADNIITAHNTREPLNSEGYSLRVSSEKPLRIVFWGMVRQVEHNKKICDAFGNDPRFTLTYHGEGFYKELEEYCKSKSYKNITFTGRYDLQDLPRFVASTDILHCHYENDTTQKSAMPVKPYDAIRYRLPMLVAGGSYLEHYFKNCHGVFSADINNLIDIKNKLYEWYTSLDSNYAERDFIEIQQQITNDDNLFREKLISFIKSN